jgi:translocation and assembly module TamA
LLRISLIYCFILVSAFQGWSQSRINCRVEISGPDSVRESVVFRLPEKIDSISIKDLINNLYAKGYVEARYKIINNDSSCVLTIDPGPRYTWIRLSQGNLPDELLHQLNLRPELFNDKVFDFQALVSAYHSVLKWSGNNGYPFAQIGLNHLAIQQQGVSALLDYNPGPLIVFDTLMITGTRKLNKKFLEAYLGIKPGSLYCSSKVKAIESEITMLEGFSLSGPPGEYFTDGKCYLKLEFIEKPVNGFDGYLGLLPNENRPGEILVTGQVKLALNNLFKSGKSFIFNWQRPNILSQELAIDYKHPCLFNSPLSGIFSFNIYKQDTSFINTGLNLGFNLKTSGHGSIGLEAGRLTSRILGNSQNTSDSLFKLADTNTSYYGVSYNYRKIDDLNFPLRGWIAEIHFDIGNKKVLRVPDNITAGSVTPENQLQVRGNVSLSRYTALNRRSAILTRISGGALSDNNLYYSDLYRIGGLSSLRGFNEKYFYSSNYIIGNFEYRLRIEEKSFLLVFTDLGWINDELNKEIKDNWPVGFGGGFNLGTPLGSLAVIYALGRDNNQAFNLKYSKIHIGYVSRF